MRRVGSWLCGVVAWCVALPLAAQAPAHHELPPFELPLAAPRQYASYARLLSVQDPDDRFGPGLQAELAVGENQPLVRLRGGPSPMSLGVGGAVVGRINMGDSRTSLVSTDWRFDINANLRFGSRWNVVAFIEHESSHVGDEYVERFGVEDAGWSRDWVGVWGFYEVGPWRAGLNLGAFLGEGSGGLGILVAAAGVDYTGGALGWWGRDIRPVLGVYGRVEEQADWRPLLALRGGLSFPLVNDHRMALLLSGQTGATHARQFVGEDLGYLAFEFRFDL